MRGLIEIAETMLSGASRRMDAAADNIANMTTPGFKSHVAFSAYVDSNSIDESGAVPASSLDMSDGKLVHTGNALDMAVSGDGFFVVRSGDKMFYTRDGQFKRSGDGHIVTESGMILQTTAGDASVETGAFSVSGDGRINELDKDLGQVALVTFRDPAALQPVSGGYFTAPADSAEIVSAPRLVQGAVEQSNTSDATQMLALMGALRGAESGQHIIQVYDDLLQQAAGVFGARQA